MSTINNKPFLKWAGGKHKLVGLISQKLGAERNNRLVEPFVGSGAVFMGTDFNSYLLCDTNKDLIDLYKNLKISSYELIDETLKLFDKSNNSEKIFYDLREEFNSTKDSTIRKSCIFIYLNRHAFNGLCRYNSKGMFNVPFGRYKSTNAPIREMQQFSEKSKFAEFICCDFEETFNKLQQGDVIYCDPPYVPLSITSSFTSYHVNQFGATQQERLANCANIAKSNGYKIVISNHDTDYTRKIYANAVIDTLEVRRSISSKAETRGLAKELLAIF